MKIELKILDKEFYKTNKLPDYQTNGSAAMDLVCTEDITIPPGQIKMVHTGLAMWISDPGVVGLIMPRSGLGTKGLVLANTIGVIDSDYQGEIILALLNRNESVTHYINGHNWVDPIELKAGSRIAQLMIVPVIKASWSEVGEFSNVTDRADGSFGSTGL